MTQAETGKQDGEDVARRNRTVTVGLAASVSQAFARAGFRDPTLVLRWSEIVGAEVARFSQPLKYAEGPAGGVLTLKAEPAAATFLQHEQRRICERINAFLGRPAVARLKFAQGPVAARISRGQPLRKTRPLSAEDPALVYAGPDKLKTALLALAQARRHRD